MQFFNKHRQWHGTSINHLKTLQCGKQGRIQEFFIGVGGGGPYFSSERTVELFGGKSILPNTPHPLPPVVVASYTLLEHPPVVLGYKDCADFQSQSVYACHRWCGKYCFASRHVRRTDHGRIPKNNYIFEYP